MKPQEILYHLAFAEGLPKRALRAATEQREEMLPLFLEQIESYIAADEFERIEPSPLMLIFHLLGQWRETAAYRPLLRLLRCDPEDINVQFGDCITETFHRVIAAVFDGSPQPLYEAILDTDADEFVRARLCEVVAMLALRGDIPRPEAARFLRDCFIHLRPQAESHVWDGWQSAIALLGLEELRSTVKKAFDRGFIDHHSTRFHHFEADLARGVEQPGEPRRDGDREFTLFGDVIDELSNWYCFSKAYQREIREAEREALSELEVLFDGLPATNPFRDVGRNDPCPCGSGKKYKRCCLR